ncbi:MAG: hypothetical protein WBA93_22905 [Microcoleaceae cyanobacterium]
MKNLIDNIKQFQLRRVIAFFVVGCLLLVSTACSTPTTPNVSSSETAELNSELYAPIQEKNNEGMYPYNDADSSPTGSDKVKRKAKSLIEKSKANIRSTDEPKDVLENIKEGASVIPEDLDESVKENAKDFVEGTKRGFGNLKENTQDAAKTVKRAAEDISDTAKEKAKAASKATQRVMEDAVDAVDVEG